MCFYFFIKKKIILVIKLNNKTIFDLSTKFARKTAALCRKFPKENSPRARKTHKNSLRRKQNSLTAEFVRRRQRLRTASKILIRNKI